MPTSTLYNEKELLMNASQGDEAAFTQLYYAYHHKLETYVYRLTTSQETAKEIVQDVFVKIWTRRELLAKVDRFGSYIYVLSRNYTLNCLRQLAKERIRSRDYAISFSEEQQSNAEMGPDPDYYTLIDQAVEELPPQQQKVYLLSRRSGMKQEEIACHMSISRETVKKYLKLATRSIGNYLRAHREPLLILLLVFLAS